MNPLRDRCSCGCATWRVTAGKVPIVRCDACGRIVEVDGPVDEHTTATLRRITPPLALIVHQLEGKVDEGIVRDLGAMCDALIALVKELEGEKGTSIVGTPAAG